MRKKINNVIYATAHSYFSLMNVIDKEYIVDIYLDYLKEQNQKKVVIDILDMKTSTILDEDEKIKESLELLKVNFFNSLERVGYSSRNVRSAFVTLSIGDNDKNTLEITMEAIDGTTYSKLLTEKNSISLK